MEWVQAAFGALMFLTRSLLDNGKSRPSTGPAGPAAFEAKPRGIVIVWWVLPVGPASSRGQIRAYGHGACK